MRRPKPTPPRSAASQLCASTYEGQQQHQRDEHEQSTPEQVRDVQARAANLGKARQRQVESRHEDGDYSRQEEDFGEWAHVRVAGEPSLPWMAPLPAFRLPRRGVRVLPHRSLSHGRPRFRHTTHQSIPLSMSQDRRVAP